MSVKFFNHKWGIEHCTNEIPCECCGALIDYDGVINNNRSMETYVMDECGRVTQVQLLPSKGIVISGVKGEGDIPEGDVIDEIPLGDGEVFYIRSSLEEYPCD